MTFERSAAAVLVFLVVGCHGSVEQVPLSADVITFRDRFLDVATLDGERVTVVGYGGKILRSDDGGDSWRRIESPSAATLMRIAFADRERGWIVGQGGLVLHTSDGGETWEAQDSGTDSHLFGLSVISREEAIACGDRSRWIATSDGGRSWRLHEVPLSDVGMDPDIALAVREPIYYDTVFLDSQTGWMVGDYGNIRFTSDGGRSWESQHASLLGQSLPGYHRPLRDALDLPAFFRITMTDRTRGLVVGVGGIAMETRDGGQVWSVLDLGLSPPVQAPLLDITPGGDGLLVFGGSGTALRRDADGFERIELHLPLLTWLVASEFASEGPLAGRRGYAVGGRGLILRTDDGGDAWRAIGRRVGGGA